MYRKNPFRPTRKRRKKNKKSFPSNRKNILNESDLGSWYNQKYENIEPEPEASTSFKKL